MRQTLYYNVRDWALVGGIPGMLQDEGTRAACIGEIIFNRQNL